MFLTDFGDGAVTLPLAAVVLAFLLRAGRRRAAVAWLVAVCATFVVIVALKLVFGFACAVGMTSPSGHTACATMVYAGLARVLGGTRRLTLAVAVLVAAAIGASRLVLGFHSPPEVLLGAAVGLAGTAVLLRDLPPGPLAAARPRLALLAASAAVVLALHGQHAPFERMLQHWRGCPGGSGPNA